MDSITDLDDNQSRLLEALQLSLPTETLNKKEKHRDKRLSLNPIYRQVPRVVDSCCQHIEKYGEQLLSPLWPTCVTSWYDYDRCTRQLLLSGFEVFFSSLLPSRFADRWDL